MKISNVLYVTTQIMGTWRYFSWIAYPNIWYARLQRSVLDILSSDKNIEASVKFYPNDLLHNPNNDVSTYKLSNVKILKESLLDILKKKNFDLIITEACATTLLEILCTKSQILCFFPNEYLRLDLDALKMLRKRAHMPDSETEYLGQLRLLLSENSLINKKEINDEFLMSFGLNTLTCNPVDLAREYLDKIISDSEK